MLFRSTATLIYIGVMNKETKAALKTAMEHCKENNWKKQVWNADQAWPDDTKPERAALLRRLISSDTFVRLVLPTAACAEPMTVTGMRSFCKGLGIEFVQVDAPPKNGDRG